jgi:hypothetical protein
MGILGKRWKDPSDSEYSPLNPSDDRFTRGAEEGAVKRRGFLAFLAVIPFVGKLAKPRPTGVSVTMVGGGGGGGSGRPNSLSRDGGDGASGRIIITTWP